MADKEIYFEDEEDAIGADCDGYECLTCGHVQSDATGFGCDRCGSMLEEFWF